MVFLDPAAARPPLRPTAASGWLPAGEAAVARFASGEGPLARLVRGKRAGETCCCCCLARFATGEASTLCAGQEER